MLEPDELTRLLPVARSNYKSNVIIGIDNINKFVGLDSNLQQLVLDYLDSATILRMRLSSPQIKSIVDNRFVLWQRCERRRIDNPLCEIGYAKLPEAIKKVSGVNAGDKHLIIISLGLLLFVDGLFTFILVKGLKNLRTGLHELDKLGYILFGTLFTLTMVSLMLIKAMLTKKLITHNDYKVNLHDELFWANTQSDAIFARKDNSTKLICHSHLIKIMDRLLANYCLLASHIQHQHKIEFIKKAIYTISEKISQAELHHELSQNKLFASNLSSIMQNRNPDFISPDFFTKLTIESANFIQPSTGNAFYKILTNLSSYIPMKDYQAAVSSLKHHPLAKRKLIVKILLENEIHHHSALGKFKMLLSLYKAKLVRPEDDDGQRFLLLLDYLTREDLETMIKDADFTDAIEYIIILMPHSLQIKLQNSANFSQLAQASDRYTLKHMIITEEQSSNYAKRM